MDELVTFGGMTTTEKVALLRRAKRRKKYDQRKSAVRRARMMEAPITGRVDRDEIIARDESTCYICGKICEPEEIHLDHVIPLSQGGAHGPENIKVACAPCNIAKGSSLLPSS